MNFSSFIKPMGVRLGMALLASSLAFSAQAVTLEYHNGGDVGSLDPHKISGTWESRIALEQFMGLMVEDVDGNATNALAESYTVSDDGLVYTFKMRQDAKWSDGEPVTAHDVVFSWRRILEPELASDYAYLMYTLKNAEAINKGEMAGDQLGVRAIDDYTLEATLSGPAPYFIGQLTHSTAMVLPKHVVEKHGTDWTKLENIVVSGPYKVDVWESGSKLHASKNPTFYDADKVQIDDVNFYVLEDNAAALKAYRAGQFDILTDFPVDQLDWVRNNLGDQVLIAPQLGLYYYSFNVMKPGLDNVQIRKALTAAIDRDVITGQISPTGILPAYSWVPPLISNYEPAYMDIKDMTQAERTANAKKTMESLGYNSSNPLKLVLRYNTNDNHKRLAVAIAAMWKEIGVEVELFNSDVRVHYDALSAHDFEIGRAGWIADYNDAENFLGLLRAGVGNNYTQWANDDFEKLMNQAALERDVAKRADIMHQAERIAMDEYVSIPIYYYVSRNIVSPKVTGFKPNGVDVHRIMYMTKSE